jgi:hypothetical protein
MGEQNTKLEISISGELNIGSSAGVISNQNFFFDFSEPEDGVGFSLPIGQFIAWAAQSLYPDLNEQAIPPGLKEMSIAVNRLEFDSNNVFQMTVKLGRQQDGKWIQCWSPFESLALSLCDLTIAIHRHP